MGILISRWDLKLISQLVFLLSLLISKSQQNHDQKVLGKTRMMVYSNTLTFKNFKPGVAAEALPDSVYYNRYVPLIFQLSVPEWSTDTLMLNDSLHCTSESMTEKPFCPVIYHMERILAPLADSMRFAKNIFTPTEGWSYFGKFSCDLIEPHFFHLSAHVDELHLYVDKLKETCSLAKNLAVISRNISLNPSLHVQTASSRFNAMFSLEKDKGKDKDKDKGHSHKSFGFGSSSSSFSSSSTSYTTSQLTQLAGFVGFQTAYILGKYIDTVRWNNAFSQCQSNRLSIGLINSFWLRNALQPMQSLAERNGYRLSIPAHEYLPHYYKLPLTDCVLGIQNTKKTTLMIRVLVPIQKKESKYTRFRLTKIPYLVTDKGMKQLCEISNFDAKDDFLLEESKETVGAKRAPLVSISPDCFEGDLCHVPEQPRNLVVDPCLKGLMNGSLEHIKEHCSFECYEVDNEELVLPIIIKVAPNQYSITGAHETKPINVFCDSKFQIKPTQVLEPNKTNGVLQVILPCNCEIRFKSDVYKPSKPCDAPLEVHYLNTLPLRYTFPGTSPKEKESGTETEGVDDGHDSESEGTNPTGSDHEGHTNAKGQGQASPFSSKEKEKEENSGGGSHATQFAFIWILILLLLGSNGFLVYIVYRNGLISFGAVRSIVTRVGFTTNPPRTRLEEEGGPNGGSRQDNWPSGLNRM